MSSVVDFLFGGSDDSAQRAQTSANRRALELFERLSTQARGDVLGLLPTADINRNLGLQAALDVFGQGTGQQLGAFQQGNIGAQNTLLGGFQPFQSAILGGPVDLSGLQAQQIAFDPSFLQQTLPQFTPSVSPEQAGLNQLAALLGGNAQIGQTPTAGGAQVASANPAAAANAAILQDILGISPGDVPGFGGDPSQGAPDVSIGPAGQGLSTALDVSEALDFFSPFGTGSGSETANQIGGLLGALAAPGAGLMGAIAGKSATQQALDELQQTQFFGVDPGAVPDFGGLDPGVSPSDAPGTPF